MIRHSSLLLVFILGCAATPRQVFELDVRARTDDGQRLAAVEVGYGSRMLGATSASGRLLVRVDATSGTTLPLIVKCPTGYQTIRDRVIVPLHATTPSGSGPQPVNVDVECRPDKRTAVVVVKSNMAGIPVLVDGKRLSATNEYGIAYLALTVEPGKHFEVALETSSNDHMRPKDPVEPFVMADRDQVFMVQKTFEIVRDPPPRKRRRHRKPKPKAPRPIRLDGRMHWGTVGSSGKQR